MVNIHQLILVYRKIAFPYAITISNKVCSGRGVATGFVLVLQCTNSHLKNLAVFRPLRPSVGQVDQVP